MKDFVGVIFTKGDVYEIRREMPLGVTNVNLSNLKTGKMKGIRFETLDAICKVLDCQPGDLMDYKS